MKEKYSGKVYTYVLNPDVGGENLVLQVLHSEIDTKRREMFKKTCSIVHADVSPYCNSIERGMKYIYLNGGVYIHSCCVNKNIYGIIPMYTFSVTNKL